MSPAISVAISLMQLLVLPAVYRYILLPYVFPYTVQQGSKIKKKKEEKRKKKGAGRTKWKLLGTEWAALSRCFGFNTEKHAVSHVSSHPPPPNKALMYIHIREYSIKVSHQITNCRAPAGSSMGSCHLKKGGQRETLDCHKADEEGKIH